MKNCPECLWMKAQPGRINRATVGGVTHHIPEICLVGLCHGSARTIQDTLHWWALQCSLAAIEREEKTGVPT